MPAKQSKSLSRLLSLLLAVLFLCVLSVPALADTENELAPSSTSLPGPDAGEGQDNTDGEHDEEQPAPEDEEVPGHDTGLDEDIEVVELEPEPEQRAAQYGLLDTADHYVADYQQFVDALAAIEQAGTPGSIQLTANIELPDTVEIPLGVDVTLSSDTGGRGFTMAASCENRRHFLVYGTLRMENIMLVGRLSNTTSFAAGTGGIEINGTGGEGVLELHDGVQIGNCSVSTTVSYPVHKIKGGAVYLGNGATMNMWGGSILSNEVRWYNAMQSTEEISGGGIFVDSASRLNMYGGLIRGNVANTLSSGAYGGGVYAQGDFYMYGGEIANNMAQGNGGGVALQNGGPLSGPKPTNFYMYDGAVIRDNSAVNSGGVFLYGGMDMFMYGGLISGNQAYHMGGGIGTGSNYYNLYIEGGTFAGNQVLGSSQDRWNYGGGAIYFSGNASVVGSGYDNIFSIQNATFQGNTSYYNAGAIAIVDSQEHVRPSIENSFFTGNYARLDGGAIALYVDEHRAPGSYERFTVANTYFANNTAGNGAKEFDLTDNVYGPLHTTNIDVTGLSSPFDHDDSDGRYNKAYNNFDITYPGNRFLTYHEVEFYVDGAPVGSEYALHNKPVRPYAYTPPTGQVLDGWYTDTTYTTKWEFDTVVTGPLQLYGRLAAAPSRTLTVEYYKGATLASATYISSETHTLLAGQAPEDTLPAGWLDAHKPPTGYQAGVLADPASLPGSITVNTTLKVLYIPIPVAVHEVVFYQNHSSMELVEYYKRTGVQEGTTFAAPPAEPLRTGYTFWGWAESRSTSDETEHWDFSSDTMPGSDLALYAQWRVNEYAVTYDYAQVANAPHDIVQVDADYNTLLTPPASNFSGYTFKGWWYAAANRYWVFGTDKMPAGNITLVGHWTKNTTPPPITPSESSTSAGGESSNPPATSSSSAPSTSRPASSSGIPASSAPASSSGPSSSAVSEPVASPGPDDELDNRNIGGTDLPLDWWQRGDGWSLLNLLVSILLLLSAAFQLVRMALAKNRREDEYGNESVRKQRRLWTVLSAVTGVVPILLLFLLEDFSGAMLLLDKWSPWFIGFALLHATCTLVALTRKARWKQTE